MTMAEAARELPPEMQLEYAKIDYKAKCALAEKLGDVILRQWCVEHALVGVSNANKLDFTKVDTLFKYIKKGEVG